MKKILQLALLFSMMIVTNQIYAQIHSYDWATSLHSDGNTLSIKSIRTDQTNNLYTLGYYAGAGSVDLDPSPTQQYLSVAGTSGICIIKQDPSGNTIWIRTIQGTFPTVADFVIDINNYVYISGAFSSTVDFNPGAGVNNLTSATSQEMFVLSLDTSSAFNWVKRFSATGTTTPVQITVDAGYNILLTGTFTASCDFDPNAGTTNKTSNGGQDIFGLQLDFMGNLQWVKTIGGTNNDIASAIKASIVNDYYIAGSFSGTVDLDPDAGVSNETAADLSGFVISFDPSANFIWSKIISASASSQVQIKNLIAIYPDGVIVNGSFQGTVDLDPGTGLYTANSNGAEDVFIQKLDWFGDFVSAVSFGNNSSDVPGDMEMDALGSIYLTGKYSGTIDFDPGTGVVTKTSSSEDIYVLKLQSDLSFSWVESIGGADPDGGERIITDADNNIYCSGYYGGTVDFDFSAPVNNLSVNQPGNSDPFVLKIFQCILPIVTADPSSTTVCENDNSVFFAYVGGVNYTHVWQVDDGTGFANISGAMYSDYQLSSDHYLEIFPTPANFNAYQYRFIVTNACGADTSSIVTLTVNANPFITSQPQNQNACKGSPVTISLTGGAGGATFQWMRNGDPLADAGIYSGTSTSSLQISAAHDSLNGVQYSCTISGICGVPVTSSNAGITTLPVYNQTFSTVICQGDVVYLGTTPLTVAGTYTDTLAALNGCDSIVTINLGVNPSYNQNISASICDGDNYVLGTQTLTSAGAYSETFQTGSGCDSVVNLTLGVNIVNTTVTVMLDVLTASASGAAYQWMDCNQSMLAISGETQQNYTATANGDYAVAVTENGCTDTSACVAINSIGIKTNTASTDIISIFPNPNKGEFSIVVKESGNYSLINSIGQTVAVVEIKEHTGSYSFSGLDKGIYYIIGNTYKAKVIVTE